MTPRELWILLEGALDERREQAHERMSVAVTIGWVSAALQRRTGRFPQLQDVLPKQLAEREPVRRRQTVAEQIAAMKAWSRVLSDNERRTA